MQVLAIYEGECIELGNAELTVPPDVSGASLCSSASFKTLYRRFLLYPAAHQGI
jgi:hypothetical protein